MAEPDDDIIIEDIPQQRRNSFSFRREENRDLDVAMDAFRRNDGNRRPEEPQPERPRQDAPRQEAPRQDVPRHDAPRQEAPRPEAPRQEAPRQEVQPQAMDQENNEARRRREEQEAQQRQRNRDNFNRQQDQRRRNAEAVENQPVENQPVENAGPNVQRRNERQVQQPERDARKENPYKGTVDAQEMKDGTFLQTQSDKIRTLRYLTREVTFGSRRGFSSPEFRKIKQDLYKLDKFMRTVNGRTSLKKEEMEEYERLTMNVRESTDVYLKKKRASLMKRAGADGKVKMTKYEQKRLLAIKELQNEVDTLRHDMFDPAIQNQKEELQKKCNQKINDMKETLDGLYQTGARDQNLKPALEGAVHQTLFYLGRMDSLSKSFRMKPGESFRKTKERLNKDLKPSEQDLRRIAGHDLTKSIVDAGMKEIKKGKTFSVDDVKRLKAEYIKKNARRNMERRERLVAPQAPEVQNRQQNPRRMTEAAPRHRGLQ